MHTYCKLHYCCTFMTDVDNIHECNKKERKTVNNRYGLCHLTVPWNVLIRLVRASRREKVFQHCPHEDSTSLCNCYVRSNVSVNYLNDSKNLVTKTTQIKRWIRAYDTCKILNQAVDDLVFVQSNRDAKCLYFLTLIPNRCTILVIIMFDEI